MDAETADLLRGDPSYRYQLLARLKSDCDYYFGHGNHNEKNLWAGNGKDQIEAMKTLWQSFGEDEKPQWLTLSDIDSLETQFLQARADTPTAAPRPSPG